MLQVTSIEHLKQLSNINGRAEFYWRHLSI